MGLYFVKIKDTKGSEVWINLEKVKMIDVTSNIVWFQDNSLMHAEDVTPLINEIR